MKLNSKFYKLFPFIILVTFLNFLLLRLWILSTNTFDLGGVEQNVIYTIQIFLKKKILYLPPESVPFSITQYSPFYYYICSYTASGLGYGSNDIFALFTISRAWNIIFNLISAVLVFKVGREFYSLSKNKSYFIFLLSFALNSMLNYAARPDSLCDMLAMFVLYLFLGYQQDKPDKNDLKSNVVLFFITLLTALAVFSKQSSIQLIIILIGYAIISKNWRLLIKFIIFSIFIYGFFFTLFVNLYPSFLNNTVGGINNGISFDWFWNYVIKRPIFLASYLPISIITIFLLIKNNINQKINFGDKFLEILMVGFFCFATLTALKMGAGVNYYISFINVAIIYIFKTFSISSKNTATKFLDIKIGFVYLFLFSLVFVHGIYHFYSVNKLNNKTDYVIQRSASKKVVEYIIGQKDSLDDKYIFANLSTNPFMASRQGINNMLYNYCLVPSMDILEVSTGPSKVLGYNNLEYLLKTGKVEYLIESYPEKISLVLIKRLEDIKKSNYKLVKQIDGYLIYKYKSN